MESTITLFTFVLLAIVLVLANMEHYHRAFRWITLAALVTMNLIMLMLGVASFAFTTENASQMGFSGDAAAALGTFFRAMGITGLLAFLPLIPPVRRLLARFIPINPASVLHTAALVYAIYLAGTGIGQQPLMSNPEVMGGLGETGGVGAATLWTQTLGMVLVAVSGVGLFTRRILRETAQRLGLVMPTLRQVLLGLGAIVGLFALQVAVSYLWSLFDPAGMAQIDEASNLLLGNLTGLSGAFTIGMAAALGEEMLFRGAMLPPFRLALTSILFTIIHSQYALSPATLLVLMIAVVLGLIRNRTNLTIAILVHFGYNFLSVILAGMGQ